MKKHITAFFMAWGMFCAIPCPYRKWDETARGWMLVYLPVVGLILGGIWALLMWGFGALGFIGALAAAVLMAAPYLLTGFIHLDGFMDCCDAILSRRDLAERQRILKDSHVGSFAVICVALLFLGGFAAFCDMDVAASWPAFVLIPAVTRCNAVLAVQRIAPMHTSQYAGGFEKKKTRAQCAVLLVELTLLLAAACCLAACGRIAALLAVILASFVCQACCYGASKNLGGMSGDISGFSITLGDLTGVVTMAVLGGII